MEAFLRSCSGPTPNKTPNATYILKTPTETRSIVVRTIFAAL